ncbi:MAG TPA: type II toxin-antitoxin system RelE/ParE family toxin [Thermoanaerobaculia bacterium]
MRRARRQYVAASRWWLEHRDKAPEAFDEDLNSIWRLIGTRPGAGQIVRSRSRGIRRVLAERVRYYVYYRVFDDRIEVLSIWHASRRPPRL